MDFYLRYSESCTDKNLDMAFGDSVTITHNATSRLIAAGSGFVYGARTIAPIFQGMYGYSRLRFVFINSVSAILWAMVGVGIGYSTR